MKSAILLTVCCALMTAPALAQTGAPPTEPAAPAAVAASAPPVGSCGAAPASPQPVDINTLTDKQITAATESLNAFLQNAQANLTCRRTGIEADRAELLAKQDVMKAQTDAYNADVKSITAVRDAWDAQVTALNAKRAKRR